jgi:hypothetical protein
LAASVQLAKREDFAPLAEKNAGSLAQIGYCTTLKIAGKPVDFDNMTEYWMEERPDHLVTSDRPIVGGEEAFINEDVAVLQQNRRTTMKIGAISMLALLLTPSLAIADEMKMSAAHGPADKAFMSAMQTMMKNMKAKPTGNPDADFVLMMMPHHQGAIDMAKVELQYGKNPELRQLASDIVAAQEKEIAQMKAWLGKNGK